MKKNKSIVSGISFFLSISLIVGNLIFAVGTAGRHGYYGGTLKETFSGDYQSTEYFRDLIAGRLESFLTMAVNGPLGYYGYGYSNETYYGDAWADSTGVAYGSETAETSETAGGDWEAEVIDRLGSDWETELERELGIDWRDTINDMGYGASDYNGGGYREPSEEDNKKSAEKYNRALEKDKNLLYNISYDGSLLYSNASGTGLPEQITSEAEADWIKLLPEGYNFLLYFDGSSVKILKDGAFVDVYGDGVYREETDWYVPGYRNFPVSEDYAGARICIAAAAEPVMYNYVSGKSGYRQISNELYWLRYHMDVKKNCLMAASWGLAVGAALFVLSLSNRKYKKQADMFVARVTGRLWIELKVLLLVLICGGAGALQMMDWNQNTGIFYEFGNEFLNSGYFGNGIEFLSYFGGSLLQNLSPMFVLIILWTLWLFVNDLRNNKGEWKHGLCYKIYYVLCIRELNEPVSKKMVRRGGLVFVISGVCALLTAALAMAAWLEAGGPAVGIVCIILLPAVLLAVQYAYQKRLKATAGDMELLSERVSGIRGGNYESGGDKPSDEDFEGIFSGLEDIRNGMAEAVDEQMKSERMKVELIANVSHDIKTPLTSIISYVELLKQEDGLPDYAKDYIRILDEKSHRLVDMVQDVFVISKAASGELPVNMETLDFGKLLRQTMADMDEQIQNSRLQFKADIPEEPVLIRADGQRLYRVFQNLLQNTMKYSLEGSRVFITLKKDSSMAFASVKNTSRSELNQQADFTERFVRGDESRTDGGSGLGLSIARSFTEACGGDFRLETIADLFVVTVSFEIVKEIPKN